MAPRSRRRTRHFTVDAANATLPLVRVITEDLQRLSCEVVERRRRLAVLRPSHPPDPNCPYQQELAQIADELEKDRRRLQDYVRELHELGIEPRNITEGRIDFPSTVNGKVACLCWKLGENEVRFWHPSGSPCQTRRPLGRAAPTAS